MTRLPLIIEFVGALALLAGLIVIPLGIGLISPAIGAIWAGIELVLLGIGLIWLMNPELSARIRRR